MTKQHHDMNTFAMDLRAACARQMSGRGRFGAMFALEVETLASPGARSNDLPGVEPISTLNANIARFGLIPIKEALLRKFQELK